MMKKEQTVSTEKELLHVDEKETGRLDKWILCYEVWKKKMFYRLGLCYCWDQNIFKVLIFFFKFSVKLYWLGGAVK